MLLAEVFQSLLVIAHPEVLLLGLVQRVLPVQDLIRYPDLVANLLPVYLRWLLVIPALKRLHIQHVSEATYDIRLEVGNIGVYRIQSDLMRYLLVGQDYAFSHRVKKEGAGRSTAPRTTSRGSWIQLRSEIVDMICYYARYSYFLNSAGLTMEDLARVVYDALGLVDHGLAKLLSGHFTLGYLQDFEQTFCPPANALNLVQGHRGVSF